MNRDSKILVTGHRGLVGDALIRQLQMNGHKNLITVPRSEVDLTDPVAVKWLFSAYRPDYVFHCAAHVGGLLANATEKVDFLTKNLAIQNNVMLNAAEYGTKKLLFLGSSCIYPHDAPLPLQPDMLLAGPFTPETEPYGIAKVAGIKLCQYLRAERGCNFIAAMPCNLYGPADHFNSLKSHVIPGLITRMHRAKQIGCQEFEVWGDGTAMREVLYADDLARALILLMHKYSGVEVVNAGSGDERTIKELAEKVAQVVGYKGWLFFDSSKPTGVARKLMDNSVLRALGWSPEVSLDEGLKRTYAGFLQGLTIAR